MTSVRPGGCAAVRESRSGRFLSGPARGPGGLGRSGQAQANAALRSTGFPTHPRASAERRDQWQLVNPVPPAAGRGVPGGKQRDWPCARSCVSASAPGAFGAPVSTSWGSGVWLTQPRRVLRGSSRQRSVPGPHVGGQEKLAYLHFFLARVSFPKVHMKWWQLGLFLI